MDLRETPRTAKLRVELEDFMATHVFPAEAVYEEQLRNATDPHVLPPVVEELKVEARRRGLWNLFLRDEKWGAGLTSLEYAPLAEITGHSPHIAPEALNCSAPDTGNMELLSMFGTPQQQDRWLTPMLDGTMRSAFGMTEPAVASSDATNIATTIERDGDEYVVNGHKWWTSGAMDPRCELLIIMGVSNPDAESHARHSMILIPRDTPGVTIVRNLKLFGYVEQHGHAEVLLEDVRVPVDHLLGDEGSGFALSQARLGPGRVHHCMRAIGTAERSLAMMVDRVASRVAFGGPLADQGVVQTWIAESRLEIEQARLLILKTAWLVDTVGARAARTEVSAIKVAAARVVNSVVDRAIQSFGAAGLSEDHVLAGYYSYARHLRFADGPDEVHIRSIARQELRTRRLATSPAG